MVEKKVIVAIPCGMHIRPAGLIAHAASRYQATSKILFKYHIINTASILNLVASGIQCGDEVCIQCDGPDEKEALEGVAAVLEDATIQQKGPL